MTDNGVELGSTRLDKAIFNLPSLFKSSETTFISIKFKSVLFAATRPDASDKPLFNIISISHSVQLFDHLLLTFECLSLVTRGRDELRP